MSIIMENSEGVLVESYKGQVVRLMEKNGYHDSDFFAIVFIPELDSFKKIEYASSRGGSYKNHAFVDASPEIMELVKAKQAKNRAQNQKEIEDLLAIQVDKGKIVEFLDLKGKKSFLNGVEGEVFWIGAGFGHGADPRVGVKVADQKYFVDLQNVKVVGSDKNGVRARSSLNIHRNVVSAVASHYGCYFY